LRSSAYHHPTITALTPQPRVHYSSASLSHRLYRRPHLALFARELHPHLLTTKPGREEALFTATAAARLHPLARTDSRSACQKRLST